MLSNEVVAEIKRLLTTRLSHRAIARKMGVSRGSVGAIASGKRRVYTRPQRELSSDDVEFSGPVERCPGCGRLIQMPCRACRVEWRGQRLDKLRREIRTHRTGKSAASTTDGDVEARGVREAGHE